MSSNVASRKPEAHTAQDSIVEVRDVHYSIGGRAIFSGLNLQIARGRITAIMGPSGTGKTTLLKLITGQVKPDRGQILFDGIDVCSLSRPELYALRLRMGMLFQNGALLTDEDVFENVAFPLRENRRLRPSESDRFVNERLAEVGLPVSVKTKRPAQLSGGMRKRVGLARALVMNPEVLLYDEPTTGLDPIMSDVINELIVRTRRQHQVTGIVVTHDMKNAQRTSDRIVMLYPLTRLAPDEPQIIFDGTPQAIMQSKDKRVAQFVRGEAGERLMEMREQAGAR